MSDHNTLRLGSNYKRYKLGTAKLVGWLRDTAVDIARRSGEVLRTAETLSTTELIRLAKLISNAKPKATVPITILLCAKDVIQGRTECAMFYRQLENAGTQTGETFLRMNKSHQHFISVLEEIQTLLTGLQVKCSGGKPSRPASSAPSVGKKATFDILELEEPSAWLNAAPEVPQTPSSKGEHDPITDSTPPDPTPTCSLEEDAEMEESFAIFCAFQDMRVVRLHLQAVWKEYYNGNISYLVAIEITKVGLSIIFDICDGLYSACPWLDSYDEVSAYLGLETSMSLSGHEQTFFMNHLSKIAPSSGLRDSQGNVVNPSELFCAPAYAVMHDFRLYVVPGDNSIM